MIRFNKLIIIASTMLLVAVLLGCSAASELPVVVDSGVIDQAYDGVPNPVLDKILKLTEEERKNGVEKITIKCGVQIDKPTPDEEVDSTSDDEQQDDKSAESGGDERDERARPKI